MLTLFGLLMCTAVRAWPDGAPCIYAALESMNPLEAVEHQGGLQLTVPPYEIVVEQKCYWRNQPIGLTIQGLNESMWFKGFVMQPFQWDNDRLGPRMGQFVRLDDNGSWQQQCFRFKDAATHSHDEKKKHIKMWWKVDEEINTIQFVATVVRHQTMFWVRSIRSRPLPPCRLNREGFPSYSAPAPTMPPPVKAFKTDTFKMFDNGPLLQPEIAPFVPRQPPPVFSQPPATAPPVRPITAARQGTVFFTRPQPAPFTTQPPFQTTNQAFIPQRPLGTEQRFNTNTIQAARGRLNQFDRTRGFARRRQCVDRDRTGRCSRMFSQCRTQPNFNYMRANCARTCGFCRAQMSQQ